MEESADSAMRFEFYQTFLQIRRSAQHLTVAVAL